jgi:hypothetical protein
MPQHIRKCLQVSVLVAVPIFLTTLYTSSMADQRDALTPSPSEQALASSSIPIDTEVPAPPAIGNCCTSYLPLVIKHSPAACTPPLCEPGQVLHCPSGDCPNGCGVACATPTPVPTSLLRPDCSDFIVDPYPPAIAGSTVTLSWTPANAPSVVNYRIQVADNAEFANPTVDVVVNGTTYTIELEEGSWHWRVQASYFAVCNLAGGIPITTSELWSYSPPFNIGETTPTSTAAGCSQPETRITIDATPSFLEVNNPLTVTYTPSNFANILNVSLIINSSVVAVQRQSGELEIYDSSTFQVLQVHMTATSTGKWLLQATTPGTFDIQVKGYGDAGFFSYIDGKCIFGTTHKTIDSDPLAVTVSS